MNDAAKTDYSGKTVLLVDDDIDFQAQIEIFLKKLSFTVVTGESQEEGEALIRETDYDLAIFDLMMENQDSGFILSYKSKQAKPDVPVILVTAVSKETGMQFDTATEESRAWIKADSILNKGLRHEQLEREIEKLMEAAVTNK